MALLCFLAAGSFNSVRQTPAVSRTIL